MFTVNDISAWHRGTGPVWWIHIGFSLSGAAVLMLFPIRMSRRWHRRAEAIIFLLWERPDSWQGSQLLLQKCIHPCQDAQALACVVIMFRKICFFFIVNRHRHGFLPLFMLLLPVWPPLPWYWWQESPGEEAFLQENGMFCNALEDGWVWALLCPFWDWILI